MVRLVWTRLHGGRPPRNLVQWSGTWLTPGITAVTVPAATTKKTTTWQEFGHGRTFASGNGAFPPSSGGAVRRRRRVKYEQFNDAQLGAIMLPTAGGGGLDGPFEYSGETLDEYTKKANLSPWTPVPDSVARKIFDTAQPGPDDVHVELGSGDGRVNFTAIEYGVGESIGIDVDEDIVKVATDRLQRIHPQPNLRFVVSDLLDPKSPAWTDYLSRATILTMYFAKPGLERIRPLLEGALRGRRCKVFTCGYAMPDWESQMVETVLDMPIHFYDWGNPDVEDAMLRTDSYVDESSRGGGGLAGRRDPYLRKNTKSTFRPDPLPGFHPDDLVDYGWDDFAEELATEVDKKGST